MIYHQKPLLGQQINWAHPLAKGLLSFLALNERSGNRAFDSSGNRNTGNLGNDASFVADGVYFDGTGDYIDLGGIWSTTGTETFFAIVRFDEAIGNIEMIMASDKSDGAGDSRNIQFRRSATGKLELIYWSAGVIKTPAAGNTTLTTGVWWSVGCTIDGTTARIFVNGQQDSVDFSGGPVNNNLGDPTYLLAGARASDTGLSVIKEPLQGTIKTIYRANKGISPAAMMDLYINPYAMFQEEIQPWMLRAPVGGVAFIPQIIGPF